MSTMHLNLFELSEFGKTFDFVKNQDQELDAELASVIENIFAYSVHVEFARAGDIFTARGKFSLEKGDQCSLCGEDVHTHFSDKIDEYLVIEDTSVSGHAPHTGLNLESKQETYFLSSPELDVFDFLREVITSDLPAYPKCEDKAQCAKNRDALNEKVRKQGMDGHPAFSVLSKLKKN